MTQPRQADEWAQALKGAGRRAGWVTWMCWALILGVIVAMNLLRAQGRPDAAARTAPVDPREVVSVQLRLMSRYAVGYHLLLAKTGKADAGQDLVKDVRRSAQSAVEKLRAVMVVGELKGPAAALTALRELDRAVFRDDLWRDADTLSVIYRSSPEQVDPAARQALVERHGWFGWLALSNGLPDDAPARELAIVPAQRTFWTLVMALVLAVTGLVCGIGLLIIAIVTLRRRPWRKYAQEVLPEAGSGSAFIEGFVIYLLGMIAVAVAGAALFAAVPPWWTWVSGLFVILAALWPRWRGVGWAPLRRGLGWYRVRSGWREPLAGVAGYVAGLPIMASGVLVTLVLSRFASGEGPAHPIVKDLATGGAWQIAGLYLLACAWAPVVEETMFRGLLYHHQRRLTGWIGSGVLVGVVFAALHPQGWTAIPALGSIGFVLAGIREWRGSIFASMTAHALNNGVVVTILVMAIA